MSLILVGDIHGWHDRLLDLLPQLEGALVFLGDLIDRGPQSRECVETVKDLCDSGRARCLLGNHEYALVRGLGVPERSITPFPSLIEAWWQRYGGQATVRSYGLDHWDPEALRNSLGDHLSWMADLPWFLEGEEDGRPYFIVHGGLKEDDLASQRREMGPMRWWGRARSVLPPQLYSKHLRFTRPVDLADDVCVISGHTPLKKPHVAPQRILCDTSGGRPGTPLTAIEFPSGRIIQSRIGAVSRSGT